MAALQNFHHRYCTETFTISPSTTTKYTPDFRFLILQNLLAFNILKNVHLLNGYLIELH